LKYIVDIKRSRSWSEQVQTIGRTSRLPKHLSARIGSDYFELFCHPRFYFPSHEDSEPRVAAQDAWDFILQMDARLEQSQMTSWHDLLEGEEPASASTPHNAAAPFTLMDRLDIDNALGELIAAREQVTPEHIERIVQALPDPQAEPRTEPAKEHIRRVLTEREYRDQITEPTFEIIRPVSREAPKNLQDYTDAELSAFIVTHPGIDNAYTSKLVDAGVRDLIAVMKREHDTKHYRQVTKIRQLQAADGKPGVLTDIRNSLLGELTSRGHDYRRVIGPVSIAINNAASRLCGLQGPSVTANDGVLDRPQYHYQFSIPSVRAKLKALAVAELMMRGIVGPAHHLYARSSGAAAAGNA
jgi:hypothetical protein